MGYHRKNYVTYYIRIDIIYRIKKSVIIRLEVYRIKKLRSSIILEIQFNRKL